MPLSKLIAFHHLLRLFPDRLFTTTASVSPLALPFTHWWSHTCLHRPAPSRTRLQAVAILIIATVTSCSLVIAVGTCCEAVRGPSIGVQYSSPALYHSLETPVATHSPTLLDDAIITTMRITQPKLEIDPENWVLVWLRPSRA
ncbi:hypothetical protein BD769DRAFT_1682308 [Suillus cothurnatus]|nr:hypothetical protein BD769DRAFT_1682308 [Suillus cothurnatus]